MVLEKISNEEKSSLTYTIQNIVVKSALNSDIELEKIISNIENTEYDKERFPGLFFRIKDPKCVCIIFRNGKMIITGLKSFEYIRFVIDFLIKELNEKINANIERDHINTEVVNIVATANFLDQINLDLTAITLDNVIFEPEVFPGLIYKTLKPIKCVFLIFNSGSIVLTGIRL